MMSFVVVTVASNNNCCSRLTGNPVVNDLTHVLQMYHLLCLYINLSLGIFKNSGLEVEIFDVGEPIASQDLRN